MGKFGIGAKVKDPDGDFGEIIGKPGKGLRTIRIAGGKYDGLEIQFFKSELEVVANDNEVSACAPVFEKEYSVGDRVRVKTRDYGENQFGKTGAVVEINRPSSLSIEIEYDEPLTPGGLTRNQYKPKDLESIEPAVAPATGPFAKGDKVQFVEDYGLAKAGAEGVVIGFWNDKTDMEQCVRVELTDGSTRACYAYRLVSVEPAVSTPPNFAKGDSAMSHNGDYVTVDTDPDAEDHVWVSFGTTKWRTPVSWLTKWEPKVGDVIASTKNTFEYTVTAVNEDGTLDVSTPGSFNNFYNYRNKAISLFQPLPVAEQPATEATEPAPLVVEAGKTYRTRDGRKATDGEIRDEDYGGGFYFDVDAMAKAYAHNGKHVYGNPGLDLVAEWGEPVDLKEEVESGRMSVNQARERIGLDPLPEPAAPPARFKVGDRVNWTKHRHAWQGGTVVSIDDTPWPINVNDPEHGEGAFTFDELELASTIPRGTLATLTTPARVAGQFGDKVNLVFPNLPAGRNSFTLPASVLAAA